MFEKMHLSIVPHFVRYGLIIIMAMSPVVALCFLICFDEDDDIPSSSKVNQSPASKNV